MFSKFMQRMSQKCATAHDVPNPFDVVNRAAHEWDRQHANKDELWSRETDVDRIWEAINYAETKNYEKALDIWRDMAAGGSVWSMIEVGRCLEYGYGVSRDLAEAESWYERAFAGGSQIALLKCAKAAALRNDYPACEAILKVGVDQDWAPAMFWLAWYRYKQTKNPATYLFLLQTAVQRGHPAAQAYLANFMVRGMFGFWRVPLGFLLALRLSHRLEFRRAEKGAQAASSS